jgi:hypothetical protein
VSGVVVSSPSAGLLKFAGVTFRIAGAVDVTATNPLILSDEIELHLTSTIDVPGFLPTTAAASIGLNLGSPLLTGSLITATKLSSVEPGRWRFTLGQASASGDVLLTVDPRLVTYNAGRVLFDTMPYATLVVDCGARALVACRAGQSTSFIVNLFGTPTTFTASVASFVTVTGITLTMTVAVKTGGSANDLIDVLDILERPDSVSLNFPASFGLPEQRAQL